MTWVRTVIMVAIAEVLMPVKVSSDKAGSPASRGNRMNPVSQVRTSLIRDSSVSR